MKLIVCAKSDRGCYIGMPSAAGYTVFTARDIDAINPGDILTNPTWDDEGGVNLKVRNTSTGEEVKVGLVSWSLSFDEARELIARNDPGSAVKWQPPWPG